MLVYYYALNFTTNAIDHTQDSTIINAMTMQYLPDEGGGVKYPPAADPYFGTKASHTIDNHRAK